MRKRIAYSILARLRDKKLSVVNPSTGEIVPHIEEDIQTNLLRARIYYSSFVKMSTIVNDAISKVGLTHGESSYFFRLIAGMNETNSIDWSVVDCSSRTLRYFQKKLKDAHLIDKIKLGSAPLWYVNPYIAHKGKTVDSRLRDHFASYTFE